MPTSRRRKSVASQAIIANLMLAPAVVMFRLPLLASEANGGDPFKAESLRAVTEKATAVAEGMVAAQTSMAKSMIGFWPELMSGTVPSLMSGKAIQQATDAAMRPAGRTVRANYKRLSAKR